MSRCSVAAVGLEKGVKKPQTEKKMKKIVVLAMLLAAFTSTAGPVMAADGAALYKFKCLMCHGVDGKGSSMGPAFAGSEYVRSQSDEAISDVILKGREGEAKVYKDMVLGMPAQKLTVEETGALVEYLRSLAAK